MNAKVAAKAKPSHPNPWTPVPGNVSLSAEASEGRGTYQAAVTEEGATVRVFVVVLVALVVVLAVLTEVCLLQAAALRRKVRAVLPPDEREEDR